MTPSKTFTRNILPDHAAKFRDGTLKSKIIPSTSRTPAVGAILALREMNADTFEPGFRTTPLAEVVISEVVPFVIDHDLLIVGRERIPVPSEAANQIAVRNGWKSFTAFADSIHASPHGLPLVGSMMSWKN